MVSGAFKGERPILPLTGEMTLGANACKNGMILASESLAEDVQNKIELVFEDNAGSAKNTVTIYQRLKWQNPPQAILTWEDSSALSIYLSFDE
jgi:hypothetical protein